MDGQRETWPFASSTASETESVTSSAMLALLPVCIALQQVHELNHRDERGGHVGERSRHEHLAGTPLVKTGAALPQEGDGAAGGVDYSTGSVTSEKSTVAA